jgi:hypothetical protein
MRLPFTEREFGQYLWFLHAGRSSAGQRRSHSASMPMLRFSPQQSFSCCTLQG